MAITLASRATLSCTVVGVLCNEIKVVVVVVVAFVVLLVPKSFHIGAQIDPKSMQSRHRNACKIDPESTKSGPGGTPKRRKEAKMKKRGVVPNSFAEFGPILKKMDSQMDTKMDHKSMEININTKGKFE